jgi:hypothetical protein
MGIRFYCPKGHKLNVKRFQAGQTGVCPRCGATMPIPLHSTRRSSTRHRPHLSAKTVGAGAAGGSSGRVGGATGQAGGSVKPPPVPSESPRAADPLAEREKVVWYVRPPSGQQLGPADPDAMRGWLAQGRIAADSLVWREGWRNWRPAGDVFPQLSPRRAIPGLESIAAEPLVTPIYPHRTVHRGPPRRTQFLVLGALVLVLLLFLAIFLIASRQ